MALTRAEYMRQYYVRNRETLRAKAKAYRLANLEQRREYDRNRPRRPRPEYDEARREAGRKFITKIKLARGCADCGYNDFAGALEFDHLPGTDKHVEVGRMTAYKFDTILAEIEKCEVVCANCHRRRTHARAMDNRNHSEGRQ